MVQQLQEVKERAKVLKHACICINALHLELLLVVTLYLLHCLSMLGTA